MGGRLGYVYSFFALFWLFVWFCFFGFLGRVRINSDVSKFSVAVCSVVLGYRIIIGFYCERYNYI